VRVKNSFVLADFVILDMEGDLGVQLILEWPFLRYVKARKDVGPDQGQLHILQIPI
jgi:hypothetical protein